MQLAPFRILRGIECDILPDGSLDLPDAVLDELDWVQASVHGGQRMPRAEMTRRVTAALEHDAVRCLSHPTGRLLGRRPESALDLDAVYAVAAARGIALEVNGLPARLDLSAEHVRARAGRRGPHRLLDRRPFDPRPGQHGAGRGHGPPGRSDRGRRDQHRGCPQTGLPFVVGVSIDRPSKEADMQYAILIYDAPGTYESLAPDELEAVMAEYGPISDDPAVRGGAQLQPVHTATTVRMSEGEVLTTDGPFADTKEVFGGYFVIEVEDLDRALEFAARIPSARLGGSIEVRPVVERGALAAAPGSSAARSGLP